MKINEVEELVGITKRNIRFYEKEGLLTPGRNSENGYRDYSREDVDMLRKIKLLRKLNIPLEEIRKLQSGTLWLDDVLGRHMIQLRRSRENLATIEALCQRLTDAREQLPTLNAQSYLKEMEQMEQEGTRFMNVKKQDTRTRYREPVIAAAVFVLLMAGLMGLIFWGFSVSPEDAPPLGLIFLFMAVPMVFIIGVLLALWQRMKQIQGGEEDAASKY
ncbi:MerR family transcriptional regulator [Pseudoflavonifractor sp. 524-17]|uniref:MerR family transcriptional regulator n=1 Tax=Pseudoflavonifractor sp. 524-17 TaxID=2304577 RepID=UPI00137A5E2D|nr:MerR family transcriptional regulator [Pseudoflavonifractor sp. 524-17]NCE66031.1 MerR family transcriptional regulator [Pseudoflavonifractor sp. 524-17]